MIIQTNSIINADKILKEIHAEEALKQALWDIQKDEYVNYLNIDSFVELDYYNIIT